MRLKNVKYSQSVRFVAPRFVQASFGHCYNTEWALFLHIQPWSRRLTSDFPNVSRPSQMGTWSVGGIDLSCPCRRVVTVKATPLNVIPITVVISRLSSKATILQSFDPLPQESTRSQGTIFRPVWSKLITSSSGTSYSCTQVVIFSK